MNAALSAFLATRLLDRANGHRRQVLSSARDLRERGRSDPAGHRRRRDGDLASLLQHAASHVPFFRETIGRQRITAGNAREVLAQLPVMKRKDLQSAPEAYIADRGGPFFDDATGGSTGTPLRFKVDAATQVAREASLMWSDAFTGWAYGERIAMLWGSDKDVRGATAKIRSGLRWWVDNRRWFNAFDMGEEEMERFHRALGRFRPHLLVAYAGSIQTYACFLKANGYVPRYPFKGIVSSAEMLTPSMRRDVEAVFPSAVFDRYGNREAGAIAAECPAHDGYHVNEADFVVEVASDEPTRTPGPILITYLRNRAMPLLRYDTGDLGVLADGQGGACPCGCHFGKLRSIHGRSSDTIRTASGKLIHGEFFTHLLYGCETVRRFQFVQESLRDYRLVLLADRPLAPEREHALLGELRDALDADARVVLEYVDHIPVLPSGKHKFTVSRVSSGPDLPGSAS